MTLTGTRDLLCHLRVAPKWNLGSPPHLRDTTITAETASVIVLIWSNLRLFTADNHCALVPLRRRNGGRGHGSRSGGLEGLMACHGKGGASWGEGEGGVRWGEGERQVQPPGDKEDASAHCIGPHLVFYRDRYAKDQCTEDLICYYTVVQFKNATFEPKVHNTEPPSKWATRISLLWTQIIIHVSHDSVDQN